MDEIEQIKVMDDATCPKCDFPVRLKFNFCPNCGKNLKNEAPKMTLRKQILTYAISILLPPLGLLPGFKYIRSEDQKTQNVGLIAIILTIFSSVIVIFYGYLIVQEARESLKMQLEQLEQLKNLQ
jgi:hypothetical protein